MTQNHYCQYNQPITIENIKSIQRNANQIHNLDWEIFKNKCKTKLYCHIMKQLNNRVQTLYRLNKQAIKGKNYIRLTDFKFPLNNPLVYLNTEVQIEILEELVDEMRQIIKSLYGPEFIIKVEASPSKFSKIMTWVMYDIYAFYDDGDSDYENEINNDIDETSE